jgi:opine dehydrogenase
MIRLCCGFQIFSSSYQSRWRISSLRLNESNATDNPRNPIPSLKVGIVGAGAVAFGTASLLSSLSHDPMIWSPSGAGTIDLLASSQASGDTLISKIHSTGALEHTFDVRVASSAEQLVVSNDNVLVFALPVNGHKQVMEALAPEIVRHAMKQEKESAEGRRPIMHIIVSSHASLGAVYLMNLLKEEQRKLLSSNNMSAPNVLDWVRITCWGTTAVTARKLSGSSVKVLTVRQAVDFCTVPASPLDDPTNTEDNLTGLLSNGYMLCNSLFGPRFKYRKGGLLAISLSNLNPQNHLGIVLGNMSRMDPPPPPPPIDSETPPIMQIEPWYQGKCITPRVGRLMESLDRERIDIANELDIEVRTIHQHFSWSFHVPLETPITDYSSVSGAKTRPLTVSEMNQQMHYYNGNDVLGPSDPESRYVLEDVPYGLVLTVILGRLLNKPAVLHESGIMILSAMVSVLKSAL